MNLTFIPPVLISMQGSKFFQYFLDALLYCVLFFIITLCVLLIYSLMISDVNSKIYEMGILRAIGLKKKKLVMLISMQSFLLSGTGLTIAITVGCIINVITSYVIFLYSNAEISYFGTLK